MNIHYLKIFTTPLVTLYLFDSSSNSIISETANLPIIFPTSNCINLDFYVTLLDSSYFLVLGYNWLIQHNPLIDWTNRLINFHPFLQENLTSSYIIANTLLAFPLSFNTSLQLLDSVVSIPVSKTSVSIFEQSNITIIGAAAFLQTSKLLSFSNLKLCLCSLNIQINSAKLAEASDLFNILSKYHEFADVFSKTNTEVLTSYCSYDLQINLEEGA